MPDNIGPAATPSEGQRALHAVALGVALGAILFALAGRASR
jgi:hypothetical protein